MTNIFQKVAFELAVKFKFRHNFYQAAKIAGKDWFKGFLERNLNLSFRKLEATCIYRIESFIRIEVEQVFIN